MYSALRSAPWEFSFVVTNFEPRVEYRPFPPGSVSYFTIADPIAQIHQLDVPRDARRNIVRQTLHCQEERRLAAFRLDSDELIANVNAALNRAGSM